MGGTVIGGALGGAVIGAVVFGLAALIGMLIKKKK